VNAVYSRCSSLILTCKIQEKQSRTQKYFEPNRLDDASSIVGSWYGLNLVTAFRARKSTQNLYLCLPSRFFLRTKMAGADQGECSLLLLLLVAFFDLGFHFVAECIRCFVRWSSYGRSISYQNLEFDYIIGLIIV
jgi:hypothetical protein